MQNYTKYESLHLFLLFEFQNGSIYFDLRLAFNSKMVRLIELI